MSEYYLKLMSSPRGYDEITLDLVDKKTLSPNIGYDISKERYIFSDRPYLAELVGEGVDLLDSITFLVNGFPVSQTIKNGRIDFHDPRYQQNRIFMDNFGYVQISIIFSIDGTQREFLSKYVSVLVRKGIISESVQRMATFVYANHEAFLCENRMSSRSTSGLKEDAPQILDSKIKILYEILEAYEINYSFFKTNGKFRVKLQGEVVNFEKAQYFDNTTLQNITRNPSYLMPVVHHSGIRVHGTNYVPAKVFSKTSQIDYDTYENRVIVGFLMSLNSEIISLVMEIQKRIDSVPSKKEIIDGYFASACFIYDVTKRQLTECIEKLKVASVKLSKLYTMYQKLFQVSKMTVDQLPKPTTILLSVHHYRSIYDKIIKWFRYGIYDFAKEDFMLPFIQMHKLYEYYVLTKLCCHLENSGFQIERSERYEYKGRNAADAVKNFNTFYFVRDDVRITIYYEPVINGKKNIGDNQIGLRRNTSISFPRQLQIDRILDEDDDGVSGTHYCPDYVVKIEHLDYTDYIILDAKFSTFNNVKWYYLPCLVYKYLFSLSPIEETDRVLGLCLVNGKSLDTDDRIYSVYDLVEKEHLITPFATILTLTENSVDNTEVHQDLLSSIFLQE